MRDSGSSFLRTFYFVFFFFFFMRVPDAHEKFVYVICDSEEVEYDQVESGKNRPVLRIRDCRS